MRFKFQACPIKLFLVTFAPKRCRRLLFISDTVSENPNEKLHILGHTNVFVTFELDSKVIDYCSKPEEPDHKEHEERHEIVHALCHQKDYSSLLVENSKEEVDFDHAEHYKQCMNQSVERQLRIH